MVIIDLLVTVLIIGINVAMLFLLFIGLRYLDTKLVDSKHRRIYNDYINVYLLNSYDNIKYDTKRMVYYFMGLV
ncbi:hypothetical protein KQUDLBSD_CDS0181 [Staphylococcus phage PG-2021_40]